MMRPRGFRIFLAGWWSYSLPLIKIGFQIRAPFDATGWQFHLLWSTLIALTTMLGMTRVFRSSRQLMMDLAGSLMLFQAFTLLFFSNLFYDLSVGHEFEVLLIMFGLMVLGVIVVSIFAWVERREQ